MTSALRYGLAINKLLAGISSRWGAFMPVVTMMLTGGQRSLTAAASFSPSKPTGEGTGLGLSISHDIIVKQHGGSIDVDTQPGEFTEVTVILPRTGVFV
jgi:Histidine kinase-, DNA gyrase B-, and HSP90-like ATPase